MVKTEVSIHAKEVYRKLVKDQIYLFDDEQKNTLHIRRKVHISKTVGKKPEENEINVIKVKMVKDHY